MPKEELKSKLPAAMDARLFNLLLVQMSREETIVQEENTVRLAAHSVSLGVDQADLRDKILQTYRESGLQPPFFRDIHKKLNVDPAQAADVLQHLIDEGRIVRTKDDLYFDVAAVQALKNRLVAFLEANDEITTPQFKEMTGASRKFVIPLIEYFDSQMVTLRVGDVRKLRRR
jgi:selenocysteine-specific elongation factor